MQRLILTVALWSAVLLPAAAQSVPINPQAGKVTESEVAFTVYQKDTSAAAVVLLDNTRVSVRTSDIIELTIFSTRRMAISARAALRTFFQYTSGPVSSILMV